MGLSPVRGEVGRVGWGYLSEGRVSNPHQSLKMYVTEIKTEKMKQ